MSSTAILINVFALVCLVFALTRDRAKGILSLKVAGKSFLAIIPVVLIIILIIGLLLGFVPPSQILRFVGERAGMGGVLLVGVLGAVMQVPALISFPLAASLLQSGASIIAVAALITTLTMVGIVMLPLEIRELGKKMAILRNGFSFIIAIIIALIIGIIL